ncbi:NAD(P)-dependent oxidoreductase [Muribaculum gordoncarteri]|jgi:NAD dependent epimerase/dehydratase family enzyme|uniref:NAD-dependent epimerase/dehydratase family protein n=2 Tax=Muribaculum TaxID=1918540 RepID=A0A4P7VDX6_9BACT|nr:NAD-dependent epimerase/dehydratase family protein [Muribaculum gordoncarteri]QCD34604.1 NAD-dependent epimerase/dehydratase family protein [Muribaculum gordoncarteri]
MTTSNNDASKPRTKDAHISHCNGFMGRYIARELGHGDDYEPPALCPLTVISDSGEMTEEEAVKLIDDTKPKHVVVVSSTAVYGLSSGENIDETAPVRPADNASRHLASIEDRVKERCKATGAMCTILRPADVVGTGMEGFTGRLARDVNNGSYMHVKGNEAQRSIVHAIDVAKAVRAVAEKAGDDCIEGVYNLTDRSGATIEQLADAIAYRLGNKRIFATGLKAAKALALLGDITLGALPWSRKKLKARTTTLTFNSFAISKHTTWEPMSVTEYLKTHKYSEDDI